VGVPVSEDLERLDWFWNLIGKKPGPGDRQWNCRQSHCHNPGIAGYLFFSGLLVEFAKIGKFRTWLENSFPKYIPGYVK
jgi:hypothetical protein